MPKTSSEFWNESFADANEMKGADREQGCDRDRGCDVGSAKALKKIISLLDELNNQDLRLLDEILDRILCERKH